MVINFSSRLLDLLYTKLGWTIKGTEDYSLEKPELTLHKAELNTELASAGGVDDSASGPSLKRKQSAAVPLANPVEDNNNAFYASVSADLLLNLTGKVLIILILTLECCTTKWVILLVQSQATIHCI